MQTNTSNGVCHSVCVSYQGKVGFGDSAVLEATVRPASSSLVEGDTKSPTGWEIQLMTEPGGKRQWASNSIQACSLWPWVVSTGVFLTWNHSRCWGLPAEGSGAWAGPARYVSHTTSCCQCGCPSACPPQCNHCSGRAPAGCQRLQALWSSCAAINWHSSHSPVKTKWFSWYSTVNIKS